MAEIVSAAELAKVLGVTRKTIAEWVFRGLVVKVAHGRYDLRASVRTYIRYLRARRDSTDAEIEQIRRDQEWYEQHGQKLLPGTVIELYELNEDAATVEEMNGRRVGTAVFDGVNYVAIDYEPDPEDATPRDRLGRLIMHDRFRS